MVWKFERMAEMTDRTCERCEEDHGEYFDEPQGKYHPNCHCIDVLCWVSSGEHVDARHVAPEARDAAVEDGRVMVHTSIASSKPTARSLMTALESTLLGVRTNARMVGRYALAEEVQHIRPELNTDPLLRTPRPSARDKRRAKRDAASLTAWWIMAAAVLAEKKHHDLKRAKKRAAVLLKARSDSTIVDSAEESFAEERGVAAKQLPDLKENGPR